MTPIEGFARSEDGYLLYVLAQLRKFEALYKVSELSWYLRIEAQAEEAVTALGWALEEERFKEGLELAILMARYWWILGTRSEGRAWLSAFLEHLPEGEPELLERAQLWLLELAGEDDAE